MVREKKSTVEKRMFYSPLNINPNFWNFIFKWDNRSYPFIFIKLFMSCYSDSSIIRKAGWSSFIQKKTKQTKKNKKTKNKSSSPLPVVTPLWSSAYIGIVFSFRMLDKTQLGDLISRIIPLISMRKSTALLNLISQVIRLRQS